jgi:4-hydroxy-3-polyprenylbenzoate decarboxylase
MTNRLIVGVTGASGAVLAAETLRQLARAGVETHLVVSKNAVLAVRHEIGTDGLASLEAAASHVHAPGNLAAPIASGSFRTMGMIVVPCSMRSLAAMAHGLGDNLLTRAADVTLKERRPLVLMVRETPLHLGHLRTMVKLAEMGAVIAPPLPAFYARPRSIEEMVDQSVGRALDLFGLSWKPVKRWGEDVGPIQGEGA